MLLHRDLPPSRQQALQRTLEAAANQMTPAEKRRGGPGPPPLLSLVQPLPVAEALQPRGVVVKASDKASVALAEGSMAGSLSPFIYNPYKAVGFHLRRTWLAERSSFDAILNCFM